VGVCFPACVTSSVLALLFVVGATTSGCKLPQWSVQDEAPTEPEAPIQAPVSLELIDVQLFHPYSSRRYLRSISDNENVVGKSKTSKFGVGIIAEATNKSGGLLAAKDLRGRIRFHLVDGRTVGCDFQADRRSKKLFYLSATPTSGSEWTDERSYPEESAWRPDETIRLAVRQDCGPPYLVDVGISKISVEATMNAKVAADGPERNSDTVSLEIPADAVTLRWVTLRDGSEAHLSGDIVIRNTEKGPERVGLAKLGERVNNVKVAGPLPDAVPPFNRGIDGIDIRIAQIEVVPWGDAMLSKGDKAVRVFVNLAQTKTATSAISEYRSLSQQIARLAATLNAGDDSDPGNGALRQELNQLKRRQGQAERVERQRIQRAIPCDKLKLVTNKATHSHPKAWTMRDQCAVVATESEGTVRFDFEVSRYEIPVALSWKIDGKAVYHVIASTPLTALDPR
jgi:hypothetical protein